MPIIKVYPSGKEFEYQAGATLLELLLAENCFVDNPCNGKGICGKCRVNIFNGKEAGIRLSCHVKPTEDLEVELLQEEGKQEVLTSGYMQEFAFDTNVKMQVTGSDKFYGAAIDIGTTTIVCAVIDMLTGKELANASMINAQKRFGLDVLTRITYEITHKETGVDELQKAVVDSINTLMEEACAKSKVSKEDIYEITVAANCTMMHMLLGVDARSIGKAPYVPVFTSAKDIKASDVGIQVSKGARLYCIPSVSAYIGADIVAGAYVCELQKQMGNVLFIDIGTNGEIVLSKDGKLLCCSCAAGPALEGMNISFGMRAAEGAIEDVKITENGVDLKVIGNQKPIGICGSGILAAVRELLKVGVVSKDGAFAKENHFVLADGEEKILVTQGDVRQVQLAKGAILSGVLALLEKAGITITDLDQVMVAGQFGAHLPVESLTGTGILPEEVKDKIRYVGNSSKTGAYVALMSEQAKREMEELALHMEYMELATADNYERLFVDSLSFPEL